MSEVRHWFFAWFERHKSLNPHHGWRAYEESGGANMHLAYIDAFTDKDVSEQEANYASSCMVREGELWPVDHLPRILKIVEPKVASRKLEEAITHRRRNSARTKWKEDERDRERSAWLKLPEAERLQRKDSIRERYPMFVGLPVFAERFAIDEWLGRELSSPGPISEAKVSPNFKSIHPHPSGKSSEQLTPGQLDFLRHIEPEQRAVFDAMTPDLRRQILAPHAQGFDRSLMSVINSELRTKTKRSVTEPSPDPSIATTSPAGLA